MPAKSVPTSAASTITTTAPELLIQLFEAINQPPASGLDQAVAAAQTAFENRQVSVEVRPASEIEAELSTARKATIKAEVNGDEAAHKEAAGRVAVLERELAQISVRHAAISELQDERRDAVDVANNQLAKVASDYRQTVGELATALEAEAKRLWAIAATARKAVETTESRFDQFGLIGKTPAMEEAIATTNSLFPSPWSNAIALWWRSHEWLCRR